MTGTTRAASETGQRDERFATVFALHRDGLVRFAVLLCGDLDLAHDVVMDTFADTWPRWRAGAVHDPGVYLRRAVVNNLNSVWRRRALRRAREEQRLTGDGRGQRAHDDQVVDRDAVAAAVCQLPMRQRVVVVLRFYEDMPTAAIAALTGTSESTVRSQLSTAARRLEQLLGPTVRGGMS